MFASKGLFLSTLVIQWFMSWFTSCLCESKSFMDIDSKLASFGSNFGRVPFRTTFIFYMFQ